MLADVIPPQRSKLTTCSRVAEQSRQSTKARGFLRISARPLHHRPPLMAHPPRPSPSRHAPAPVDAACISSFLERRCCRSCRAELAEKRDLYRAASLARIAGPFGGPHRGASWPRTAFAGHAICTDRRTNGCGRHIAMEDVRRLIDAPEQKHTDRFLLNLLRYSEAFILAPGSAVC